MKFLLALPLALALLMAASVQVAATGPTRTALPAPDFLIVSDSCSFAVRIDFTRNSEYIILFRDANGDPSSAIITGALTQRFTNLTTGKSILVNASGPGFLTTQPDGSVTLVLGGRSTVFTPGKMFLNAGRIEFDASGNVTNITGKSTDLCAALS
jgi:hypothetical protein